MDPNYPKVKIIKRIPKSARYLAATKLSDALETCVEENSPEAWAELFNFAWRRLYLPGPVEEISSRRSQTRPNAENVSLTTKIKRQLEALYPNPPVVNQLDPQRSRRKQKSQSTSEQLTVNDQRKLSRLVDQKLAEGDIKGAVRLVASDTGLAPFSQETVELLKLKHPMPTETEENVQAPEPGNYQDPMYTVHATEENVHEAIRSFPPGSAGGPDGLRPIHLKDLISASSGDAGLRLLSSITKLVNLILGGEVCAEAIPVLFGASLCALEKKGGGIRPIAVGNTFRRISGKVLSNQINSEMGALLRPTQLGYGTKSGCEAAIHSVREFIKQEHNSPKVMLKGDYANAFNSINRPTLLTKVKETAPKAWHYTQQAYG